MTTLTEIYRASTLHGTGWPKKKVPVLKGYNSVKNGSIFKILVSFDIVSSWIFQNCPWNLNWMKICTSYLIKTELENFQFYSVKNGSNFKILVGFEIVSSWIFQNCPWNLNLMKIWSSYLIKTKYWKFQLIWPIDFQWATSNFLWF